MNGRPWQRPGQKTWTVIIEKGKKLDGKPDRVWRGGFATKAAAEDALVDMRYALKHGTFVDVTNVTIAEWADIWLRDYCKTSAKTKEGRESDIRLHIKPDLGTIKLQKLTTEHVQQAYNLWGEGRSPNSVRAYAITLKLILRQAVASGHLNRMPTDGAKLPSFKKKKVESLTRDEMNQLLAGFEGHWLYPLVHTGLMTGMRRGELLGLKWSRINGTRLEVAEAVGQASGVVRIKETKTSSSHRTIEIDPQTVEILAAVKRQQAAIRLRAKIWEDNDLVFCKDDGTPLAPADASGAFARAATKAGFPRGKANLHVLRHTHATQLFAAGATLKMVQERLGHANAKVTADIYLHTLPGQDAQAARMIAGLIDLSPIDLQPQSLNLDLPLALPQSH